jgi:hypothetical protein
MGDRIESEWVIGIDRNPQPWSCRYVGLFVSDTTTSAPNTSSSVYFARARVSRFKCWYLMGVDLERLRNDVVDLLAT